MLGNATSQPRIPSGFCCVGSASVRGRAFVRARRIAGERGPHSWRDAGGRPSLVSRLAGRRPHGLEGRRPCGAQATARGAAARAGRSRIAQRPRGSWVRHGAVDVAARGHAHRAAHARAVPPGPCLVHPAASGVVAAAPDAPRAGARRGRDRGVEATALAAGKKNARRRRGWIVFEDESGVSHRPVVRRTWAPRGHPLPGRHPCAPRAAARGLRPNPSPLDAGLRLLAARGTVLLTWPLLYFTRLIRSLEGGGRAPHLRTNGATYSWVMPCRTSLNSWREGNAGGLQ